MAETAPASNQKPSAIPGFHWMEFAGYDRSTQDVLVRCRLSVNDEPFKLALRLNFWLVCFGTPTAKAVCRRFVADALRVKCEQQFGPGRLTNISDEHFQWERVTTN